MRGLTFRAKKEEAANCLLGSIVLQLFGEARSKRFALVKIGLEIKLETEASIAVIGTENKEIWCYSCCCYNWNYCIRKDRNSQIAVMERVEKKGISSFAEA